MKTILSLLAATFLCLAAAPAGAQKVERIVMAGGPPTGVFGIFAASGTERLLRDARLGRIHPANPALTHEIVGKLALGINPDEQPRWG